MTSLISEPHQLSGQCIARRYQVSKYLFYDATFSLFEAQDLVANEPVSLLCFSPGLHLEFPEAFYHLEAHMQRMTGVHHPFGLQLLASGEEHDLLFFVEEYPKGQSLSDILEEKKEHNKPFLLENALILFHLIYQTLADIHQFMIHGFLNPQDIYLEPWPQGSIPFYPKIAHIGMRSILHATPLAFKGLSKKSICYAAPEFGTSRQHDKRIDVYGLGVLLYSLLTMEAPTGCFIRPSSRHSLLTRDFDLTLIRATEADPDQRHPSITAFYAELKKLKELERIWAKAEEIYRQLSESQKEKPPASIPLTQLKNHTPSVGAQEAPMPHILDLLDGKHTPPKPPQSLLEIKDLAQKISSKGTSHKSKQKTPRPVPEIHPPLPEIKESLARQNADDSKIAAEEEFFLIEGPGRILCLLIIILLNLALFGLTAKENASLNEKTGINTRAFTKWEQFFLDSEIRYAQGIHHAE